MYKSTSICLLVILAWSASGLGRAQVQSTPRSAEGADSSTDAPDPAYILGPGDQVSIWALGFEEIPDKPIRIDPSGDIDLPVIGQVRAAGKTVAQLRAELTDAMAAQVKKPLVSITVTESAGQPVSILGAVNKPGVHQIRGVTTLVEALSLSEGLRPDAGSSIHITRRQTQGPLPLPHVAVDATGKYSVAKISVKDLMEAKIPAANITVQPFDVISIPRATMIYVTGQVRKSGGFLLTERDDISVLEAVSLAEGLGNTARPSKARILRKADSGPNRTEIPVDLSKLMAGQLADIPMQAEDILFIPDNKPKSTALRAVETAINVGTGIAIWRVGLPR